MKHIFVINPTAGPVDSSNDVLDLLKKYDGKIDYETYITKSHGDATAYVRNKCDTEQDELRFYACGGDGTLNEVLNGMIGCNHASLTHYPIGSGNDFIKYFNNSSDFFELDKLINGKEIITDCLKVNNLYSINITNFGLDAKVCFTMNNIRRKKLIGGKRAYGNSVIWSLIVARKNFCKVTLDGREIHNGRMLLCAVANAKVYGGGYRCAPEAVVDDGLFDLCLLKAVPLRIISKLLGVYKAGNHLQAKLLKPYLVYEKGEHLEVVASKGIAICRDGEVDQVKHFTIDIVKGAVKFVIPQ